MSYSYLASPYSHPTPERREERYHEAAKCLVWLIQHKVWTYSPIVHCHHIARKFGLGTTWSAWKEYNRAMLVPAERLLILTLDGWDSSVGVTEEVTFAHSLGMTIHFIHPGTYAITEEPDSE